MHTSLFSDSQPGPGPTIKKAGVGASDKPVRKRKSDHPRPTPNPSQQMASKGRTSIRNPLNSPGKKAGEIHAALHRKLRRDAVVLAVVFAIVLGYPTEVAAKFMFSTIQESFRAALVAKTDCNDTDCYDSDLWKAITVLP